MRNYTRLYGVLLFVATLGGCASFGSAPVTEGPLPSTTRFKFDHSGSVASNEATGARFVLFKMTLGERVKQAATKVTTKVTTLKAPVAVQFIETTHVIENRVLLPLVREPADLAQAGFERASVTANAGAAVLAF